ncbi:MAG: hypothetical protein ACQEWW_07785 [Bacillota bacterium]
MKAKEKQVKCLSGYWLGDTWSPFPSKPVKAREKLPNGKYRNCLKAEGECYAKIKHVNTPNLPTAFNGTNLQEVYPKHIVIENWQYVNIKLLKEVVK